MKKVYISQVTVSCFLVILVLSFVSFSPVTPTSAVEYESLDGFDVHPESGRWTTVNVGTTATIDNGRLKVTDTGDTSVDYYRITRDVRDLEGFIEVRFMFLADIALSFLSDRFYIALSNGANSVGLDIRSIGANTNLPTFYYYDTGSGLETLSLSMSNDTWYVFRLDYSILENTLVYSLFNSIGTRLYRYNWQDLGTDYPEFFDMTDLELEIQTSVERNTKVLTTYVDYVNAPFDERNWRHSTVGSSGNWLSQASWEFTRAQDDIDDEHVWRLNVPNLDRITGIMAIVPDDRTNMVNGDYLGINVRIYCVDANDGDLHEAFEFYLRFYMLGGVQQVDFGVWNDGFLEYSSVANTPTDDIGALQFIVGAKNDRSLLVYEILGKWDTSDESQNELFTGDVLTSAVATVPSQEFVIEIEYDMNFDANANGLVVDAFIDDWELVNNAWWLGLAVIGIGFLIAGVLLYVATGGSGGGIFQPIFDIFDALVKGFSDILRPVISWLGNVISDFFDWLFGLAQDFLDFIVEIVFLIWDAVGLPDILALIDWGLAAAIEIIGNLPAFLTDIANQLQAIWDLLSIIGLIFFFVIPLLAGANIGQFFEKMLTYMGFDITFGLSIIGIRLPVPAVAVWLVVLQFNILDGTAFAGFLTW